MEPALPARLPLPAQGIRANIRDLSGAVEDYQLYFQLGYAIAQGDNWPEWKPGDEFKAKRDEMLQRSLR